jgi:hypothetical protein
MLRRDWSSDVCSSDLTLEDLARAAFGSGLYAEGDFSNGPRGALHGAG